MCIRDRPNTDPWRDESGLKGPTALGLRRRFDAASQAWASEPVLVRLEREPFAHGAMRQCHRLKVLQSASRLFAGAGTNFVAKAYCGEPDSAILLEADVRMQAVAKSYAAQFNAMGVPKPVDFVECWTLQLAERDAPPPPPGAFFSVECYLPGAFTKYSSNSGFVTDEVVRHTPHAFSHFTFEQSEGCEMVVDVQGVGDLFTLSLIHI